MKGHIKENLKRNQGIALVVSLIVLLILAGVSLSAVFSEKGIFKRVESTSNKYNEAKAREVLETVLLGNAQYEKQTNPTYNQDDFLDDLIKKEIQGADIKGDVAIVEEYAYELDRSVPKIGKYLGLAKDLVFPTVEIISEPALVNSGRESKFTVRATDESKGITRIELWLDGKRIDRYTESYDTPQTEITKEFTVNRNGEYTIKAYADLMGSICTDVKGVTPTVRFSPNGDTTYKKEHTTQLIAEETGETITEMKYLWVENDGVNEPAESRFTETCSNNNMITGQGFTGKYYLWVLLKTDKGRINICGSEAFYFDNTAPTAAITTEWVQEDGNNRLKIFVNSVADQHSGINNNSTKLYVTPENGTREEKRINIANGEGTIFVDGLNIESLTNIELSITDNAENVSNIEKTSGKLYLIRDGILENSYLGSYSSSSRMDL